MLCYHDKWYATFTGTVSNRNHKAAWLGPALLLLISAACARNERPSSGSAEILVAAAADLKFALEEIVKEFRRKHRDAEVKISYGSSGNFYSQLLNRAPFDIYFSADLSYPKKLREQGLTLGSEFTYAVGRIIVWAPSSSNLDVERLKMDALRQPRVRHIAIANPRHAPYGRAAEAAMRSLGVYHAVKDKLVLGENIVQAFQFVQSGSAEVGVVALSLVLGLEVSSQGRYWEVPLDAYPRLEQGGAILKWAKNPQVTQNLRSYVQAQAGRAILKRYGFGLPEE